MTEAAAKIDTTVKLPEQTPIKEAPTRAQEIAGAKKDAATEKTQAQAGAAESLLQTKISTEANQKILKMTGIDLSEAMASLAAISAAIRDITSIFRNDNDPKNDTQVINLLAPAGIDVDEIDAAVSDVTERVEPEAPPEPEEQKTDKPKWTPKAKGIERSRSWKELNNAKITLQRIKENNYEAYFDKASAKYRIPKATLKAIGFKESGMNTKSRNADSDARGIAQVVPGTLKEYREKVDKNADPNNPETGIMIIAWHARNSLNSIDNAVRNGTMTGWVKRRNAEGKVISRKKITYRVKPEYKIGPDDVANLYLTHNSGPLGYIAYRCYLDALNTKDPQQVAKAESELQGFQARVIKGNPDWKNREYYARTVAELAYHIDNLSGQTENNV